MFAEMMVSSKHCVIVEDNTCLAKLVRRVSRFVRCFTVETHHVTQCNSSRYKAIMKKKKAGGDFKNHKHPTDFLSNVPDISFARLRDV